MHSAKLAVGGGGVLTNRERKCVNKLPNLFNPAKANKFTVHGASDKTLNLLRFHLCMYLREETVLYMPSTASKTYQIELIFLMHACNENQIANNK